MLHSRRVLTIGLHNGIIELFSQYVTFLLIIPSSWFAFLAAIPLCFCLFSTYNITTPIDSAPRYSDYVEFL